MVEKLLSTLSPVMNCSQQNKYKIDHFTLNQTNGEEGGSFHFGSLKTVLGIILNDLYNFYAEQGVSPPMTCS